MRHRFSEAYLSPLCVGMRSTSIPAPLRPATMLLRSAMTVVVLVVVTVAACVPAAAANFACDSGDLSTTCTVSTVQVVSHTCTVAHALQCKHITLTGFTWLTAVRRHRVWQQPCGGQWRSTRVHLLGQLWVHSADCHDRRCHDGSHWKHQSKQCRGAAQAVCGLTWGALLLHTHSANQQSKVTLLACSLHTHSCKRPA